MQRAAPPATAALRSRLPIAPIIGALVVTTVIAVFGAFNVLRSGADLVVQRHVAIAIAFLGWLAVAVATVMRPPATGAGSAPVVVDTRDDGAVQGPVDDVAGLTSRAALFDRLDVALRQLGRRRPGDGVATVLVDLDLPRSRGGVDGDDLVGAAVAAIGDSVRGTDTVGRVGAARFVVVATQVASADAAAQVGERIRRRLGDLQIDGRPIPVGVRVGTSWSDRPEVADVLIRRAEADAAHHRPRPRSGAVEAGVQRARVVGSDLGSDLHGALERGEFELWYQPIVDVDARVVAAEALLRWRHPDHGILGPGVFLRPLMDAGRLCAVGRWVVGEALRVGRLWQDAGVPMIVHVNLSPFELSSGVIDDLRGELRRSGVSPSNVCVEVTESAFGGVLISNGSVAELGATGARIALDDFGMGVSSISHLRHRPLHAIKLDRLLVAGIGDDADESIISGVLDIARSLGLDVVAEGVESSEQAAWLRERGCRRFQGHLYAPAVPAEQVVPGATLGPDRCDELVRG